MRFCNIIKAEAGEGWGWLQASGKQGGRDRKRRAQLMTAEGGDGRDAITQAGRDSDGELCREKLRMKDYEGEGGRVTCVAFTHPKLQTFF